MLFGIGMVSNVSAATENYCEIFKNQLSELTSVNRFGDENNPWSANDIAFITAKNFEGYEKYYNVKKSDEWNEVYSLPKKKFETLANKLFDVKVDLTTANYNGIQSVVYRPETKTYDLICIPAGGGYLYDVYGYSVSGKTYSIYLTKVDYEAELGEYALVKGNFDGKYLKIVSCKEIKKLPSKSKLIEKLAPIDFKKSYLKSNSSAYLSWNKISGAKSYKLQYKISGAKKWETVKTTKTSVTVKGLQAGKKYVFKVTASTKNGESISEQASLYTLKKVTAKVKTKTKTTVTLSWDKNKNADGYIVYKRTSQKADWKAVKTIKKNSTVKYKVTKLKSNKTVYFKVVSYSKENGKTVKSSGKSIKVKTKK